MMTVEEGLTTVKWKHEWTYIAFMTLPGHHQWCLAAPSRGGTSPSWCHANLGWSPLVNDVDVFVFMKKYSYWWFTHRINSQWMLNPSGVNAGTAWTPTEFTTHPSPDCTHSTGSMSTTAASSMMMPDTYWIQRSCHGDLPNQCQDKTQFNSHMNQEQVTDLSNVQSIKAKSNVLRSKSTRQVQPTMLSSVHQINCQTSVGHDTKWIAS